MAATGKTVASELTAAEKATAVMAIVTADGARAMGDFSRTSDGAANQLAEEPLPGFPAVERVAVVRQQMREFRLAIGALEDDRRGKVA